VSVLLLTNLFVLFVVLISANVAALVFARTATRESEIIVRARHRGAMSQLAASSGCAASLR